MRLMTAYTLALIVAIGLSSALPVTSSTDVADNLPEADSSIIHFPITNGVQLLGLSKGVSNEYVIPILNTIEPSLTPIDIEQVLLPLNHGPRVAYPTEEAKLLGQWSQPWDSHTGSYGGWVPYGGVSVPHLIKAVQLPSRPYATIHSKRYQNGNLLQWTIGPIDLAGKKLIIKKKYS